MNQLNPRVTRLTALVLGCTLTLGIAGCARNAMTSQHAMATSHERVSPPVGEADATLLTQDPVRYYAMQNGGTSSTPMVAAAPMAEPAAAPMTDTAPAPVAAPAPAPEVVAAAPVQSAPAPQPAAPVAAAPMASDTMAGNSNSNSNSTSTSSELAPRPDRN